MYLIAHHYARTEPSRHLAVDGSWYQQSLSSPRRHSAGVPTGGSAALPRVELAHVALRLGCRLGLTYCQCRLQRQVAVGASNPYFRPIGFQAVSSVYRTDSESVGSARHGLHGNDDSVTGRCGSTSATHTHPVLLLVYGPSPSHTVDKRVGPPCTSFSSHWCGPGTAETRTHMHWFCVPCHTKVSKCHTFFWCHATNTVSTSQYAACHRLHGNGNSAPRQ
jgi:hypothetical protein